MNFFTTPFSPLLNEFLALACGLFITSIFCCSVGKAAKYFHERRCIRQHFSNAKNIELLVHILGILHAEHTMTSVEIQSLAACLKKNGLIFTVKEFTDAINTLVKYNYIESTPGQIDDDMDDIFSIERSESEFFSLNIDLTERGKHYCFAEKL